MSNFFKNLKSAFKTKKKEEPPFQEIFFFEKTDIGAKKSTLNNEDCVGNIISDNGHAFVLCDGLGGHKAGEVASALAVDIVSRCFSTYAYLNPIKALEDCFQQANSTIFKASVQVQELSSMATTMVMAIIKDNKVYYAHTGDSRLYYYVAKDKVLHQKTKDDTVPISEGGVEQELLSKSIGLDEFIELNIHEPISPLNNDIIMLCSDGLYNMLSPEELLKILGSSTSIEEKGNLLIDSANKAGGIDNISLQLIEFK